MEVDRRVVVGLVYLWLWAKLITCGNGQKSGCGPSLPVEVDSRVWLCSRFKLSNANTLSLVLFFSSAFDLRAAAANAFRLGAKIIQNQHYSYKDSKRIFFVNLKSSDRQV